MQNTLALLDFYNRPGGRYTYYPFHGKWDNNLLTNDFINYLSNQNNKKIDLYIHIPFCHSLCSFCGCNIKIMKSNCDNDYYIQTLKKEWELYPKDLIVENLYIGGGTPNFLTPKEILNLLSEFHFTPNKNITIEVDPRYLSIEDLNEYKKMDINRISFGIQDFDTEVLKNVNRDQNEDQIIALINHASKIGFTNINLDFIYGLNFQTKESFTKTIAKVKNIQATSISLYPFAKVPWQNNFQTAFGESKEFNLHELNELLTIAAEILEDLNFKYIGMGYFSKEQEPLRRNIMGFTPSRNDTLIGLGVSAISSAPIGHAQNEKIYSRYLHSIQQGQLTQIKSHLKTNEEDLRQNFFEEVICLNFISNANFEKFKTKKMELILPQLLKDELLIKVENGLMINPSKRFFHKAILQYFDPNFIELQY